MSKRKLKSQAFRRIAKQTIQEIAEGATLPIDQNELATSLVRQWITYDGHAMLLIGDEQFQINLTPKPEGGYCVGKFARPNKWAKLLPQDWKIESDNLSEIFDQLNRGQSVEVTNSEGLPLRIWANPQEGGMGVEPLANVPVPPGTKRDYHKIASRQVEEAFGWDIDGDMLDELAFSVARQWQQCDGHAYLFANGQQQFGFEMKEETGGGCSVATSVRRVELDVLLANLGISVDMMAEVIHRINLLNFAKPSDNVGGL